MCMGYAHTLHLKDLSIHPQSLVSAGGPGTNLPWKLSDNCI